MENIGDRLRAARENAHITRSKLSELTGVSEDAISKIERGIRKNPRVDTISRLASALQTDFTLLARGRAA